MISIELPGGVRIAISDAHHEHERDGELYSSAILRLLVRINERTIRMAGEQQTLQDTVNRLLAQRTSDQQTYAAILKAMTDAGSTLLDVKSKLDAAIAAGQVGGIDPQAVASASEAIKGAVDGMANDAATALAAIAALATTEGQADPGFTPPAA